MITIEDPPERPVCTACMSPLVWVLPAKTKRWTAMVAESELRLQVHRCDQRDRTRSRWEPSEEVADTARRGRALADTVLAEKAQERIEKGSTQ